VLVAMDGTRVLTDPLLVERLGPLRRRVRLAREAIEPLVLDAVLISHAHHDHLHLPSLRQLVGRPPLIVPIGLGRLLARHRFEVIEVAPGDSVTVGALRVTATPALHHGGRGPLQRAHAAIGYRVDGSTRVYFAGDTDLFPAMSDLAGTIDVALLPVWGWGPSLGRGHLDPTRAAEAVVRIRPRIAVPIHWGTFYPAGLSRLWPRPLERPPLEFRERVERVAPACAVHVLAPGDALVLD
jgi:L-ascorbate metabolism protein UlaG (beta-lactamase superfamily)